MILYKSVIFVVSGYRLLYLRAHIGLYFDSREPAVMQHIVVYGKWATKEAHVISYMLMTSEWHP